MKEEGKVKGTREERVVSGVNRKRFEVEGVKRVGLGHGGVLQHAKLEQTKGTK